jgi:uncharacterized glyoxalase superfamily protein PhnB
MEELRAHLLRCAPPSSTHTSEMRRSMKALKLTPNLVVRDVSASLAFYRNVLGFERAFSVPDDPPHVFAACGGNGIEIFFNDRKAVGEDYPALAATIGGSFTMFIEVDDLKAVLANVEKHSAKITMPVKDQFYGMREFAFEDPDGYVITIAEKMK